MGRTSPRTRSAIAVSGATVRSGRGLRSLDEDQGTRRRSPRMTIDARAEIECRRECDDERDADQCQEDVQTIRRATRRHCSGCVVSCRPTAATFVLNWRRFFALCVVTAPT